MPPHDTMISVGIFGRRAAACLLAAGLLAAPAFSRADGVMLIQAGAFWMGRDDGSADEAPSHRVYVRDFWIDRHKVTNAEFATAGSRAALRRGRSRRAHPPGRRALDRRSWVRAASRGRGLLVWRPRLLRVEGVAPADRGRVGEGRPRRRPAAVPVGLRS